MRLPPDVIWHKVKTYMATIMIVDDDANLRQLLRRILRRAKYDVVEAANGQEALVLFRQQPTDLVITDLFMPQQDGLETISALRRLNNHLPIIAISGGGAAAQFDMLRAASLLGAARVLMKPFSIEEVHAALRDLLPANPAATESSQADMDKKT